LGSKSDDDVEDVGMRRPVEVTRRQEKPSAVDGIPAQEHCAD
jgi:hypothetical protein